MRAADARGHGDRPWWWDAVCYQVDVGAFADGDGDGVGDLEGLRGRFGYLELLGVDAILLAGTAGLDPAAADFAELLAEAHDAEMRVMVALDVDPARADPRAVLEPWLAHGVDGFHLAPREDPAGAIRSVLAGYPDRVVIGAGDWHLSFNLDLTIAGFAAESLRKVITGALGGPGPRTAWAMATRDSRRSR
ncbi:alpha-amylase family glycosyl hydrolase, partial [Saccharopolyspora kobensis]